MLSNQRRKLTYLFLLTSSLLLHATPSQATDVATRTFNSAWDGTFDLLIARPVGAVATVLGTTAYAVTLPVNSVTGRAPEVEETYVRKPFRWTFNRPIGDFGEPPRLK